MAVLSSRGALSGYPGLTGNKTMNSTAKKVKRVFISLLPFVN
jgi:hypothetical protein